MGYSTPNWPENNLFTSFDSFDCRNDPADPQHTWEPPVNFWPKTYLGHGHKQKTMGYSALNWLENGAFAPFRPFDCPNVPTNTNGLPREEQQYAWEPLVDFWPKTAQAPGTPRKQWAIPHRNGPKVARSYCFTRLTTQTTLSTQMAHPWPIHSTSGSLRSIFD